MEKMAHPSEWTVGPSVLKRPFRINVHWHYVPIGGCPWWRPRRIRRRILFDLGFNPGLTLV